MHLLVLPRFAPDLQSGEFDTSSRKSEPVCRFELTDFIENCIVCDGYRLFILASDFFDSVQSEDIKHV